MPTLDYSSGDFFIGQDEKGHPIGITTERHAITIAGAGAGKGVAVIIPNLLRWPHNALVIDPKGEAVEATAKYRQDRGQSVHVLDPFNCCSNWKEKASLNPLDAIDTDSLTAREDIGVLADGIVMRGKDGTAEHWDKGASDLIAGVIAMVLLTQKPHMRNLITVRKIIADKDLLEKAMTKATKINGCGNLPQNGASAYFAQEGGYFISNAEKNTSWLDSPAIQSVFKSSSFSLSDLKNENTTVYLVLPANYLVEHGRFLRLFVRSSIEAMQKTAENGNLRNKQCLFLLDEFFALGYINEIATSAGLMRGYGLQLWPILQDFGQLTTLYGQEGAQTFFGNSDLHQFFGNTDQSTLQYMSHALGNVNNSEIPIPPSSPAQMGGSNMGSSFASFSKKEGVRATGAIFDSVTGGIKGSINAHLQAEYQDAMNKYQQETAKLGRPRMQPDEIAKRVRRKDDVVADSMLCVTYGSDTDFFIPAPYFRDTPNKIRKTTSDNIFDVVDQAFSVGYAFLSGSTLAMGLFCISFLWTPQGENISMEYFKFSLTVGFPMGVFLYWKRGFIWQKIKQKIGR